MDINKIFYCFICLSSIEAFSQDRPNVVILYADDLGYGDVSCYNPSSKVQTPNIDRLAERGVLFTDAHAGSAISSPSRYSILTGSYSWRTDRKSGNPGPGEQPWIKEGTKTIASMLRDNGYSTVVIGKWGLGADWEPASRPGRKGLDVHPESIDFSKPIFAARTAGFTCEILTLWFRDYFKKYYPYYDAKGESKQYDGGGRWYFENGVSRGGNPQFEKFDMRDAQLYYIQSAVDFIDVVGGNKENPHCLVEKGQPFFLHFVPPMPHQPYVPAKQFQGKSGIGIYGDYIMEFDWAVGRIMNALERNKLLDNTIIIFTSDNGPEVNTYDYVDMYSHYSMGEFRGLKRDNYQGGHTVPFIVSYPKKFLQGRISNSLISQTDILRTLSDFLNLSLGKNDALDSFSFLDDLLLDERKNKVKQRTFAIHHSANGRLALRKGDWVLINGSSGNDSKESFSVKKRLGVKEHNELVELFNIKTDPKQTVNLAKDNPELVIEMMTELLKYVYSGRTYK